VSTEGTDSASNTEFGDEAKSPEQSALDQPNMVKTQRSNRRGVLKAMLETIGAHPLATGTLAVLGILGFVISVFGFGVDRREANETTEQLAKVDQTTIETNDTVERTKSRVDEILENVRQVPPCDDGDVYLKVMHAARQLGKPFSGWTLRGGANSGEIERGRCWMNLLFLDGKSPEMIEAEIIYSTIDGVIITGVNSLKMPGSEKREFLAHNEGTTSVYGTLGAQEVRWYYLNVEPGRTVRINVPEYGANAVTVVGVGDMRSTFEFEAADERYEFFISQSFRSVSDTEFELAVTIE